jgi:hypothetical protein
MSLLHFVTLPEVDENECPIDTKFLATITGSDTIHLPKETNDKIVRELNLFIQNIQDSIHSYLESTPDIC